MALAAFLRRSSIRDASNGSQTRAFEASDVCLVSTGNFRPLADSVVNPQYSFFNHSNSQNTYGENRGSNVSAVNVESESCCFEESLVRPRFRDHNRFCRWQTQTTRKRNASSSRIAGNGLYFLYDSSWKTLGKAYRNENVINRENNQSVVRIQQSSTSNCHQASDLGSFPVLFSADRGSCHHIISGQLASPHPGQSPDTQRPENRGSSKVQSISSNQCQNISSGSRSFRRGFNVVDNTIDMPNANSSNSNRFGPANNNEISSTSEINSQSRNYVQPSQADVPAPPKRRQKRKESPGSSPKSKHAPRNQRHINSHVNIQQHSLIHQNRTSSNMPSGSTSVDVTRNERMHSQNNDTARTSPPTEGSNSGSDHLPDILNAHMPPPYSTLPQNTERSCRLGPPPPPQLPPPVPPCGTLDSSLCPPSPRRIQRFSDHHYRRSHRGIGIHGGAYVGTDSEDQPKHCCGVAVTQTVSIRWFIVMIAFVGLCCSVIGTVLGALKATGREHLTVSLLMIGVGIVLITVSGIAWRLTSHDAPSCRMMLGLNSSSSDPEPNRRFVPRVPPNYGRPHHPYAAMMYPEFQYRPPPPSYQASMQEYRLRLLLLDRQQPPSSGPTPFTTSLSPVSPPPTYRSHTNGAARPTLNFVPEGDYSRPPSYRSRASSALQSLDRRSNIVNSNTNGNDHTLRSNNQTNCNHSRNASLNLSYLSHESLFGDSLHSRPQNQNSIVTVVETHPNRSVPEVGNNNNTISSRSSDESNNSALQISRIELVSGKNSKEPLDRRNDPATSSVKGLDVNMVTIVQTTDSSQVLNQDSVIVTVSGRQQNENQQCITTPSSDSSAIIDRQTGEVEILAHL